MEISSLHAIDPNLTVFFVLVQLLLIPRKTIYQELYSRDLTEENQDSGIKEDERDRGGCRESKNDLLVQTFYLYSHLTDRGF